MVDIQDISSHSGWEFPEFLKGARRATPWGMTWTTATSTKKHVHSIISKWYRAMLVILIFINHHSKIKHVH